MKMKITATVTASILVLGVLGQKATLELSFLAMDSTVAYQLDSIKIMNRTQGGDTVLYWPDTVLVIDYQVGITEQDNDGMKFKLYQNYPNPVSGQISFSLNLPGEGEVDLVITEISGKRILKISEILDRGLHLFNFTPGIGNLFIVTAKWHGYYHSIKIIKPWQYLNRESELEYLGMHQPTTVLKHDKAVYDLPFSLGDDLLYIGYVGNFESGILDAPDVSQTYTFEFAHNVPCLETPTVEYEGQIYQTRQIFSQCWLKENLNVGNMIPGASVMADNDIIEKYCYNDQGENCDVYGGLYQWDEMMQYALQPGARGICPPDWHIPTHEEWKVLAGAVDSHFGIGDPQWEGDGWFGLDAGTNLKSDTLWFSGNNGLDQFGFSCLPAGERGQFGNFSSISNSAMLWTSSLSDPNRSWFRSMYYARPEVYHSSLGNEEGYSVRCLRDF